MAVDPKTSLKIVTSELEECIPFAEMYRWDISEIDEQNQTVTVEMKSPVDQEEYLIELKFNDYKTLPLFIEFIEPDTGKRGTKRAYPKSIGSAGRFFHGKPCICHPCSRKAYKEYGGPHDNWKIKSWITYDQWGSLKTICSILLAIWGRISNPDLYGGRMNA